MRPVFLNQLAFEYEGGELGFSDYEVDSICPIGKLLRLFGEVGRLFEIAPHPVTQVGGLADIDYLTPGVLKNIDARLVWQELQAEFDIAIGHLR